MAEQLLVGTMRMVNVTFLCWRRLRLTRRSPLVSVTQYYFAAMAEQLLVVMIRMVNVTFLCWRRLRHMRRSPLVAVTQYYFAAMAEQLLVVTIFMVSAFVPPRVMVRALHRSHRGGLNLSAA